MNKTTIAFICCSSLLSACDNSSDSKSGGLLDKATSMVSDAAKDAGGSMMDKAKEAADNVVETAKEDVEEAVQSVKDTAEDTARAAVTEKTDELMASAGSVASSAEGEGIYKNNCKACHDMGIAGSPKLGDSTAWSPRIAQGNDVMVKHAIEGFKGKTGYMPPKGGFMSLSDADVSAAVSYMVSQSR